ncbi:hypothetical protein SESBI_29682 [Sesbania bispinosa]|nr:hypothetical protein SESBI_29682 [Sesbania bispinosa]
MSACHSLHIPFRTHALKKNLGTTLADRCLVEGIFLAFEVVDSGLCLVEGTCTRSTETSLEVSHVLLPWLCTIRAFVSDPFLRYKGGDVHAFYNLEIDNWSYFEAMSIVKELGYLGGVKLWWRIGKHVGKYEFKSITWDSHALEMANYAIEHNCEINLVLEHVSIGLPNVMESLPGPELVKEDQVQKGDTCGGQKMLNEVCQDGGSDQNMVGRAEVWNGVTREDKEGDSANGNGSATQAYVVNDVSHHRGGSANGNGGATAQKDKGKRPMDASVSVNGNGGATAHKKTKNAVKNRRNTRAASADVPNIVELMEPNTLHLGTRDLP